MILDTYSETRETSIRISGAFLDEIMMVISGVVDIVACNAQAHGLFQRYCEHFGIDSN
jgi:hypothetical protein